MMPAMCDAAAGKCPDCNSKPCTCNQTDIVKRLRNFLEICQADCEEAADEIERLTAALKMSDVKAIRDTKHACCDCHVVTQKSFDKAADEIERLRAEVERLQESE
jgi:polyhydroxyalkanoate synthesis regulator phasin